MNRRNKIPDSRLFLIGIFVILLVISFLFLPSCSRKYERNIERKIIMSSFTDKIIDENDYNSIKALIENDKDKNKKLEELSKSDTLICSYIKDLVGNVPVWCPTKEVITLEKIRFYIETSQSMGGYMNKGTDFQDVVNNLIGILGTEYSLVRFVPNTIVRLITKFQDVDDFSDKLTNSEFNFGGHSPLDEIFKLILDSAGKNDINFFITDGIMSGSDNDIKLNPQFNLQQRTLLMNKIRSRFAEVKDSCGVSVYGFKSRFNYDPEKNFCYFTYENDQIKTNFLKRPFYVFVFGNRQLLTEINKVLKGNTFFRPEKELSFGVQEKPLSSFTLFHSHFPQQERGSCLLLENNTVKCNYNPTSSNPIKFAVGLNLSELPDYAKNDQYLNAHLQLAYSNNLKLVDSEFKILPIGQVTLDPVVEQRKCNSLGCTHFLDLTVTDLYTLNENINVKLLNEEDKWYEDWSCDDDENIRFDPSIQEKTFNFRWLIYGIREAYKSSSSESFVEITIPINK